MEGMTGSLVDGDSGSVTGRSRQARWTLQLFAMTSPTFLVHTRLVQEVRLAGAGDAVEVGRVMAEGFVDDPVMTWVFRGPEREAKLHAVFGFLAREALVPLGATYLLPGSSASWTPPDTPPWPSERGQRFVEEVSVVCSAEDLERFAVLDAVTSSAHPVGRYWYLGVIATVPPSRGRGLGSMLLAQTLRIVDHAALPAYLESTNPRNVSLYERHGFVRTGVIDLPDGPSLTAMWRDPRER
jgi:ribosomal protein S18 acetylase RimI-like enzyme